MTPHCSTSVPTPATGYEGRIGRYGPELSRAFLAVAGPLPGGRALDVGCGTGVLTAALTQVCGPHHVVGVDPSAPAVTACRTSVPSAEVVLASAEALPFGDQGFDAVLAQLVVPLMDHPVRGVTEMRRVTRRCGIVAACVWDFSGGMTLLRTFWDAAIALDPAAAGHDQARTRPFATAPQLHDLWQRAGVRDVRTGALTARGRYRDFDDLWQPLVAPDGAPGEYFTTLGPAHQEELRTEVERRLGTPQGPFVLSARAWYVAGQR